jgi:flavin reductase (DIM6/NTAB) family NADH-FMN oxidoreductase RutF
MKTEAEVREGLKHLPIRPVYLASVAHEGKKNIISIGMFAHFSGKPTIVGIGIAPKRYSYELIRKSGEFVVNIVDEKLTDAVKICGQQSGRDIDKFQVAHLTPEKGTRVNAPLIGESPVSIECKVIKEVEVGDHVWFMGEVLATKVREGYDWKEGLLFKWIGEDGVYYKVGKKTAEY